jgi:hypothetical protein
MVGLGSERLVGRLVTAEHCDCRAVQDGQALGQAGTTCRVPVFVPPAIFEKEMAVFDLPMIADMAQQLVGCDPRGIEACQKITAVVRYDVAVGGEHVAIDAQADPTARKTQLLANVIGVV